jgi:hypothetical protein
MPWVGLLWAASLSRLNPELGFQKPQKPSADSVIYKSRGKAHRIRRHTDDKDTKKAIPAKNAEGKELKKSADIRNKEIPLI